MNLKECYIAFEGDYDEIMGRLMTEERVKKFLALFPKDDSFASLCTAMEQEDYETAFRMAHTLKGICLNLGLGKLFSSSNNITEALRGNVNNGADELLPQVKADYELTVNSIKELD